MSASYFVRLCINHTSVLHSAHTLHLRNLCTVLCDVGQCSSETLFWNIRESDPSTFCISPRYQHLGLILEYISLLVK